MTLASLRPGRWRWLGVWLGSLLYCACSHALSVDEARHLLTRTGFGATPAEIAAMLPLTRAQAVDRLLSGLGQAPVLPAPYFISQPRPDYFYVLDPKATNTEALKHVGIQEMQQLRVWWLAEMIATPQPMTERLALFWHQHFTSKYFASFTSALFWDQVQLFRTRGVTSFADLLHDIVRDPLMLIFLDNDVNTRQSPNENLARELLELFTLGRGHYQQADIKALARILAGHGVDIGGSWQYRANPADMDNGPKTFLGVTGNLTLDQAVDIILAQPRTAEFIAEKFYREFVDLQPNQSATQALADVLRNRHYQMQPFLRALLLSDEFWQNAHRGSLIKSPIELLVGFARSEGVYSPDLEIYASYAAILGHELFEPDNVEGWRGGTDWLSPQSLSVRQGMVQKLWALRASGLEYLQHHEDGLWVRYSAEVRGTAGYMEVLVNGQPVGRIEAHQATRMDDEGESSLPMRAKPVWELAHVPAERLPARIRNVTLRFTDSEALGAGNDTNMFINWVEWHGQRIPAYLARQRYLPACGDNTAQVPTGMLYCDAVLEFAFEKATRNKAAPASWQDRHAPLNSIIEGGTARLNYTALPGARSLNQLLLSPTAAWQAAGLPWQFDQISAALLASHDGMAATDINDDLWRLLTLDARYNLK